MTLVQRSSSSALARHHDLPCAECVKESVVWAQCGKNALATASGHFCSLECLRVWAIKRRLMRDEIK